MRWILQRGQVHGCARPPLFKQVENAHAYTHTYPYTLVHTHTRTHFTRSRTHTYTHANTYRLRRSPHQAHLQPHCLPPRLHAVCPHVLQMQALSQLRSSQTPADARPRLSGQRIWKHCNERVEKVLFMGCIRYIIRWRRRGGGICANSDSSKRHLRA